MKTSSGAAGSTPRGFVAPDAAGDASWAKALIGPNAPPIVIAAGAAPRAAARARRVRRLDRFVTSGCNRASLNRSSRIDVTPPRPNTTKSFNHRLVQRALDRAQTGRTGVI